MSKHIDIEELIKKVDNPKYEHLIFSHKMLVYFLKKAEENMSIDIVHCKDCKHCIQQKDYLFCDVNAKCPSLDYYCADGEKK